MANLVWNIFVIVCVITGYTVDAAAPPGGQADPIYTYEDTDYAYEYNVKAGGSNNQHQMSNNFDYGGEVIKFNAVDTPLLCYSCEFELLEDGHIEGYEGCNEPFKRKDIPEIECESSCSKKYEIKSSSSYSIRRSCLPNCKERSVQDKSYVQCCTTSLCNGVESALNGNNRYVLLVLSAAFAAILMRQLL